MPFRSFVALISYTLIVLSCAGGEEPAGIIHVDSSVRYQTFAGWEATAEMGHVECEGFERYRDEVFTLAADALGITRLRVEVRPSAEHPGNWFQSFLDETIDYDGWREYRYQVVNDNADPDSINWEGFYFTELDETVHQVVLPLRQRLEARGERLMVNVNYVAFTGQSPEGYIHEDPREYAEFVLATYLHLDQTFGFVPDMWEVILEPDNRTPWTGRAIGEAIAAAGRKLGAYGYEPAFVAPSTMNTGHAATFIDEMMTVDGIRPYIEEFSYHRYGGATQENIQRIVERGERFGIPVAMLEYMEADQRTVHEDLTVGQNVAWQQLGLAYCNATSGRDYINIDLSNPEHPVVRLSPTGRYYQLYFRHIRPGDIRIGAQSTDQAFEPVAFSDSDGGHAVVINAENEGTVGVVGLPSGVYGIEAVTDDESVSLAHGQQEVSASDTLWVLAPGAGVVAVFSKSEAGSRNAPE